MERHIELQGCLNFRDLGGYKTADGRRVGERLLYRSDGLHELTPADVARVRDELGVTDVIDLRSTGERKADGIGPLEAEPIAIHHTPLFDGDTRAAASEQVATMNLADRYLGLLAIAREPIARVVALVAGAQGGAVYHCSAGKDRTGVISALLLKLLGVPDEVIVADYALSRKNLDAIVARLERSEGYREMFEHLPPDTLHAEPETMVGLLRGIDDQHGSAEDYLAAAGAGPEVVARLRARVLV